VTGFLKARGEVERGLRATMIRIVILDLDGPILDGKFKHYACYRQIITEHGHLPVDLDSYWRMKRERVDLRQQLTTSGAESIYESFKKSWLDLIEQPNMLVLDRLQPGVIEKLQSWRDNKVRLVVATLRRYPERLHDQLTNLGLGAFFDYVAVCEPSRGGHGKAQRLKNVVMDTPPSDCLWVGDTEVDVEAARSVGCPIWAVTCGLRAESYLTSLAPDFLSPDITYVDLRCAHER